MSRSFSPAEVNALLPELEALCDRLDTLEAELGARANELERLGTRPLGSAAVGPSVEARRRLVGEVQGELRALHAALEAHGGTWLDVEERWIGFPARHGGRALWLAWRPGLERVAHYALPEAVERRLPLEALA